MSLGLAFDEYPNPGAATLVLVHGFTQNARCWAAVLPALCRRFRVLAVDAPGHGRSPTEHDEASLPQAAAAIAERGGRAHYLGYSMGGRMCLQLACDHPELVERLILVGATPGLRDEAERTARHAADTALADHLLAVGLTAFLDEWLALPLFAGLSVEAQARAERLGNRLEGVAASLRRCGTGSQSPLWSRLGRLAMPVMFVAGADDAKFAALANEMLRAIRVGCARAGTQPQATVQLIAGAGHTAHLEQPAAFLDTVARWYDEPLPTIERPTP